MKEKQDFHELFESSGFLRKIKLQKMGLWELNFERDQNRKLFEHRNYESWCIKIGNLRNHSKAEFIEIMNKMIIIMIIISSEANIGIGAWETGN